MSKKKAYVYLSVVILLVVGYFSYNFYQEKQLADFDKEKEVSDFEDKIPTQCEAGEWIDFPDFGEKSKFPAYVDNAVLKMADDEESLTNQDGSVTFVTDDNYSLYFFEGLESRIEGLEIGTADKRKVYVKKIKCVGKEANQSLRAVKQHLMNYISGNINSLALEKNHSGDWEVETFYFVNDNDLYVEYQSKGSLEGTANYDEKLWLIRIAKMDVDAPKIETLAYIEEDEEDPEKNVVKVGQDLYKENENMTVYEFDKTKKAWILQ